ncbi:hypothetical protein [Acinetobacter sp. YH12116]|uniref:hypothetical protein n=1 Tax=Acinetobacter sp. YH12116 TaxID=2601103 RepID=UPI0015D0EF1E|nr:hypothetical protein [Acinetobacter sp. YH12116]
MSLFRLRIPTAQLLINFAQIILIFGYLTLNIISVGEMGTGILLLAGFVGLAGGLLFVQGIQNSISVYWHFFLFLMFIMWIVVRVIIDLQDLYYLKQITVATTGGILLFFLMGTFARRALDTFSTLNENVKSAKLLLIIFALLCFDIFLEYSARLVRTDIFYIDDVDGGYQRAGSFLILLFIMGSFVYLKIISNTVTKKFFDLIFWLIVYSVGLFFSLVSSQMIGSNAATANLLAIYPMTVVISFLAFSQQLRNTFLENKLSVPLSKSGIKKLLQYSIVSVVGGLLIAVLALQVSGFDLNTTRIFGFGDGTNSSIDSRLNILKETGSTQMGYSPIWGNINVAYLTTGNSGLYLHNFIPNIVAELGVVGVSIVIALFFLVFRTLIRNIRTARINAQGFQQGILNLWLFCVLLFLFIYANFSVSKGWLVIWFFMGFSISVFAIRRKQS